MHWKQKADIFFQDKNHIGMLRVKWGGNIKVNASEMQALPK